MIKTGNYSDDDLFSEALVLLFAGTLLIEFFRFRFPFRFQFWLGFRFGFGFCFLFVLDFLLVQFQSLLWIVLVPV
jgi:hypothetical protein